MADFPFCVLNLRAAQLAQAANLRVEHWEEDGLGAASGFICRLPDGLMLRMFELEYAVRRHIGDVLQVEADLFQLQLRGIDACIQALCTAFGVTQADIAHVNPDLPFSRIDAGSLMRSVRLPRLWCDFNAMNLGEDEGGHDCFYSFDRHRIDELPALFGRPVILYSEDSATEIAACFAIIEPYYTGRRAPPYHAITYCGARARAVPGTWYHGEVPWQTSS